MCYEVPVDLLYINVCYADAGLVDVTYTHAVGELVGWSDVGRGLGFDYINSAQSPARYEYH